MKFKLDTCMNDGIKHKKVVILEFKTTLQVIKINFLFDIMFVLHLTSILTLFFYILISITIGNINKKS